MYMYGLPQWLGIKDSICNAGATDASLVPGSERSPGGENDNPLQSACLENPVDRGAWRALVHGVRKSWAGLKSLNMHTYTHINI